MRFLSLTYLFLATCTDLLRARALGYDITKAPEGHIEQQPPGQEQHQQQHPLPYHHHYDKSKTQKDEPSDGGDGGDGVPAAFFSDLERLSRLVDISYCVGNTGISKPFSCVSRCSEFPDLELVQTWNTGALLSDSCGYIAVDHGEGSIVVAFRGTYSITNTVVDLSTIPQEYVPYPEPGDGDDDDGDEDKDGGQEGGKEKEEEEEPRQRCANCTVHMGFLASWRQARKLVLPALEAARLRHPDYAVRLVGHSLGGAVAALAALELRLVGGLGEDELVVTTFGEPRVGNAGLAGFIDEVFGLEEGEDRRGRHTTTTMQQQQQQQQRDGDQPEASLRYRRVTHANDPVPLLPLSEWGYRSHAGEVFIGKVDLPPSPADLRFCSGDADPTCSAGGDSGSGLGGWVLREGGGAAGVGDKGGRVGVGLGIADGELRVDAKGIPTRLKLWQLFFAHRDYFWRLGLCVPGGDPADWGRDKYSFPPSSRSDEL